MGKRRKYFVGYLNDRDYVHGREHLDLCEEGIIDPLTITEAKKLIRTMYEPRKAIIYELTPVPKKEKK